ncbi:4-hydroxyphenylpyruvate dioxygenase 2 [Apiospora kogelbergensis]|uniref:4-hydroxyphenylpyruvate dioxygenase 2 n=1 Tax=Apiospora kogelbergensis TaxID=1337665 RepID=UPI00313239FC
MAITNVPEYTGFDYIGWYVGNALQAATYFVSRFGFKVIAYRGPETGSYLTTSYVITNGTARMVFTAPLSKPGNHTVEKRASDAEWDHLRELHAHLTIHGDGVKDIAFQVDSVHKVWEHALRGGAVAVRKPTTETEEGKGTVTYATIQTYGDTVHTFVDRSRYSGAWLPGFKEIEEDDPLNKLLPPVRLVEIDHCVGNQPWDGLDDVVKYYEEKLQFHRFWSVDDKSMCTDYSAMRSVVVASPNESIKMPMNEPAVGLKKSQIEEFVNYYNGAGCQHIAFSTPNIVEAVQALRTRGVQFLSVPGSYYVALKQRLAASSVKIAEDLAVLQKHNILVDFDEGGYLLQIFAKHVVDRPTVFVEIIQRYNFDGFGSGNFKGLFEAFEREQDKRGNL